MSWTSSRARIAAHRRNHPHEPVPQELYRDLRAARAAEYIEKLVADAPPLTAEQRDRLALLLRAGGGGRAA